MAISYGTPTRQVGARYVLTQPVTLDSSYPTGGYALDQTFVGQFPDGIVDAVLVAGINQTAVTASVVFQYNASTGKLQAFWSAASGSALSEVTAATNLSAYTVTLVAFGR